MSSEVLIEVSDPWEIMVCRLVNNLLGIFLTDGHLTTLPVTQIIKHRMVYSIYFLRDKCVHYCILAMSVMSLRHVRYINVVSSAS
jgi:hypothetical protein